MLSGWVDRHVLPGKLLKAYYGYGDNEGILSTIPAVATALLGGWRRAPDEVRPRFVEEDRGARSGETLGVAGGFAWGQQFPIIKNLWTSSFVLLAAGYSAWLLALFYLLVDVIGFKKPAYFFVVIGANAITIYWVRRFVDFRAIAGFFLSGTIRAAGSYGSLVEALGVVVASWILLVILYRNRIFLRV